MQSFILRESLAARAVGRFTGHWDSLLVTCGEIMGAEGLAGGRFEGMHMCVCEARGIGTPQGVRASALRAVA
eukprot:scaffold157558_cov35-Tisochrysis_lutea.AAC.8